MPYSSTSGKAFISRFLSNVTLKNKIKNVLDIGAGSGTYSQMFRNKLCPSDHSAYFETWTAVEIWEPYIDQFKLNWIYDHVIVADARTVFNEGNPLEKHHRSQHFDLAFIGDVLEHMTVEEAQILFAQTIASATFTIISIPLGHYPQDEYLGNPFERHVKDDWSHEEVILKFGDPITYTIDNEIGVYVYISPHAIISDLEMDRIRRCGDGPIIAAYGIIKNESDQIERLLENLVFANVDQIVLCDTGSTDDTLKKIADWNSVSVHSITVMPWRFDQARNTALSFVSPHVDICISIDGDELLDDRVISEIIKLWNNSKIKPTRINHKFRTEWGDGNVSEHYHERIHARSGYRWSLPVHEILEKYDGEQVIAWIDAVMIQRPDLTKSRSSYYELLKQSVVERPDVWKSWSFFAGECFNRGDLVEAKNAITKALALPDADHGYLHYQLATIYLSFGQSQEAIVEATRAVDCQPNIRELRLYLADLYFHAKKYSLAKMAFDLALDITTQTTGYLYSAAAWDVDSLQKRKAMIEKEIV